MSGQTFYSLFDTVDKVEVPVIQRDYAQGRASEADVRTQFLGAILCSLTAPEGAAGARLDLDFIYGSVEGSEERRLLVLDGQQRLTTLFLLHWYLAVKDGQTEDFNRRLARDDRARLIYATRNSAGEFFNALVTRGLDTAIPRDRDCSVTEVILDSTWFALSWRTDPTVRSALVMIDAMHDLLCEHQGLYQRLASSSSPRITFQFLELDNFGLSDDLYIKMNARGKPLTVFENFKAWLVGRTSNEDWAEKFDMKLDQEWLDFFWELSRENEVGYDFLFLRFFYVMAFFRAGEKFEGRYNRHLVSINKRGWLVELRESAGYVPTKGFEEEGIFDGEHIRMVWKTLDYIVSVASVNEIKLLYTALRSGDYLDLAKLYAFHAFIQNEEQADWGTEAHVQRLTRWMRVTNNLLNNMRVDEMQPIVSVIRGVRTLAEASGDLYEHLACQDRWLLGFANKQGMEEIRKAKLIEQNVQWEKTLVAAERHPYLQGRVGFLLDDVVDGADGLAEFEERAAKVHSLLDDKLLESDERLLQRALLAIDDYLLYRGAHKWSFGSTASSTYRERAENWLQIVESKPFSKLLESVERNREEGSLRGIINGVDCGGWRQLLVERCELINYCGSGLLHREGGEVFLLRKTRLSGFHAEVNGYYLSILLRELLEAGELPTSVSGISYQEVYDRDEPRLVIYFEDGMIYLCYRGSGFIALNGAGERVALPDDLSSMLHQHCSRWTFT